MKKLLQISLLLAVLFVFGSNAESDITPTLTDSMQIAGKHLSFGHMRLKNKQYDEAESQLLKAWTHLPMQEQTLTKRTQSARLLGRLYHETEQYDNAIQWYQQAVTLSPDSEYNKSVYRTLGNLYMYQQKPTEAIETFEKLLTYDLEPKTEIEYLYHLVVLTSEQENFDRALHHANRWAELAPNDTRVQELLGKLHLRTGDEEEAIAQMEKVMEMNPNDFKTLGSLATYYFNHNEWNKAFDAYTQLHTNKTQNFLYLEKLRTISKELQKPKTDQLAILQKMHHLQPENLNLIETLADQTEDEKWIEKGFKLDPQNGRLQYLRGDIFYKKWQQSKAESDSSNAMLWYQKALSDATWKSHAAHMINVIHPPKTREQQIADDFFKKTKITQSEVNQTGKK